MRCLFCSKTFKGIVKPEGHDQSRLLNLEVRQKNNPSSQEEFKSLCPEFKSLCPDVPRGLLGVADFVVRKPVF